MRFHSHAIVILGCGLLATAAYAKKPVCGDGSQQAAELCDGADLAGQTCQSLGFAGGTLGCLPDCTFDTSACDAGGPTCGNGVAETGEDCDGADLGGLTCLDLGYTGGTLGCVDCAFDTSGCISGSGSCGDGHLDAGEECDGAADAACPGSCSAHCACPAAAARDSLEIHVIDVGQGDAILVISPDGFVMLVDAGEESEAGVVNGYLDAIGVTGIDYTLVSHMHTDHLGGMDLVLAQHPDAVACFDHGGGATSTEFDEYLAAAGDRRQTVDAGQTIDLGPSVVADVLHGDVGASLENNNSVVVRITYGGTSVLLGGDCQSGCENDFDPGPIDVYKVHHHGSSDASTDALLASMQPLLGIISVGADNAYGHPDADTLTRLATFGVETHRTDLEGDLVAYLDGTDVTLGAPPTCQDGATRDCGTTDVGACALGVETCQAGSWGACVGAVDPVAEVCDNGADDDCDGLTDAGDSDCGGGSGHVVISQVGYDTPGTDELEEFFDLYNPTGAAIDLSGWTVSDNLGSWTLPAGTSVPAGGFISVARDAGGFAALYGLSPDVEGLSLALGNTGDVLILSDAASTEVDRVAWEGFEPGWDMAAATGDAIERADPTADTDSPADWSITSPASPRGGSAAAAWCGDGVCDAGEDCHTCAGDCPGKTGGKPDKQFCCGNGVCEPVGEDAATCPIDCH